MMILPLLEFITFFIYAELVILIFSKNPKALVNQLCALLFVSFAIWTVATALMNSSAEKAGAIFWLNISSFGWCSFASFYFWFTLIFTKQNTFPHRRVLLVGTIIAPAVFIYYQFSGQVISDLRQVPGGWSTVWSDTLWSFLLISYYSSLSVISLILTYRLFQNSRYAKERKQAVVILTTGILSLLFGSVANVVLPHLPLYHVPPLADLTGLIWAGGIAYSITQLQLLSVTMANAAENILSAMGDSVILMDPTGKILEANQASFHLLGFTRAELLGMPVDRLFAEEDVPAASTQPRRANFIPRLVLNGFDSTHPVSLRAKAGSNIPVHLSSSVIRESSGEVIGIVCVCRDIRELLKAIQENETMQINLARQQAEQAAIVREVEERRISESALRQTQSDLQTAVDEKEQLLSAITSLLVSINPEGIVTHWNEPAAHGFGLTAEETVGRPFRSLAISWDWDFLQHELDRCRQTRQKIQLPECTIPQTNGPSRTLALALHPLAPTRGGGAGLLILGSDITEQVVMQQQLEQRNKLESIGQLATGIAHELNTPAQFIGGNLRFLHDQLPTLLDMLPLRVPNPPGPHPARTRDVDYLVAEFPKAITQSLDGIARISGIVSALRDFSHPGATKLAYANINQGLESTIMVARNEWKYIAEVETNFAPDLPLVECYPGEINQVFLNILINAVHTIRDVLTPNSSEKGKITVSTSCQDDWVEVHIADSGKGIPKEIRNRVFDPFFTTKEVGRGTGQGLAISHYIIVQKHGGSIHFETEEGRGTDFIIRLPVQNAQHK